MTADPGPLRVLWLSPWMRPLARVQAELLIARGHEVLLVTSDQHPESDAARAYELVLTPSPKRPSTWPEFARALGPVRRFGADVVVTELVRDPRWLLLAGRSPRVNLVHDDRPHDAGEQVPGWERRLFTRWNASARTTVAFSRYVADAVARDPARPAGPPVDVINLPSDLAPARVPEPVGADARRDFVVFGRLNAYKNLAVTFAAWRRHVEGPAWRGDELVLIGSGELPGPLPPHARWESGAYTYAEVLPTLARAKASLVHYRQASQSGVQVLALQLGVTPIVSPLGALPEFQPDGERPVGVDDVDGLADALDALADPATAQARGDRARAHYRARFGPDATAARWEQILAAVIR